MTTDRAEGSEVRYRTVGTAQWDEDDAMGSYTHSTELFECLICGCLVHNFARHNERCKP